MYNRAISSGSNAHSPHPESLSIAQSETLNISWPNGARNNPDISYNRRTMMVASPGVASALSMARVSNSPSSGVINNGPSVSTSHEHYHYNMDGIRIRAVSDDEDDDDTSDITCSSGVHSQSTYSPGVHSQSTYSPGVHSQSTYSPGVHSQSTYSSGVHSQTTYSPGIHESTPGVAININGTSVTIPPIMSHPPHIAIHGSASGTTVRITGGSVSTGTITINNSTQAASTRPREVHHWVHFHNH